MKSSCPCSRSATCASGVATRPLLVPISVGYTPPPRAPKAVEGFPFLVPLEDETYAPEGAYLGTHEGDPSEMPV